MIDDQNNDLDSSIYPISTSNSSFSSVHIDGESDELPSDFDYDETTISSQPSTEW